MFCPNRCISDWTSFSLFFNNPRVRSRLSAIPFTTGCLDDWLLLVAGPTAGSSGNVSARALREARNFLDGRRRRVEATCLSLDLRTLERSRECFMMRLSFLVAVKADVGGP
jgi:hypothetical protein